MEPPPEPPPPDRRPDPAPDPARGPWAEPAQPPVDSPRRDLARLVDLAGLGEATLAEFGAELTRLADELEAAFGPEAGHAEPAPPPAAGLGDLRDDAPIDRHRADLWLAEAPERRGEHLRVPPALEKAGEPGARLGARSPAPPPRTSALDPWNALVARREAGDLPGPATGPATDAPLAGLEVAVKANLACEGLETTAASRALFGWTAPYTATVVRRLVHAGARPVATANMDEFAMGSSGEHSAHGPTVNPWSPVDRPLAPGGSSSGSAAAVAAGLVPLALGSDAGGSVRQPAALCGVTGLRPSRGRLSRFGLVAFASGFDTVGPLARGAAELAPAFAAMAGADPRDATSGAPARGPAFGGWSGITLGVPRRLLDELGAGVEPAVARSFERALAELEALGARLVEVALTSADAALSAYHVVSCAEAASNLARFDGARFGPRPGLTPGAPPRDFDELVTRVRDAGFGREVKRRILIGTLALARPRPRRGEARGRRRLFAAAAETRAAVTAEFEAAFATCDLVALPTSPTTAFPLGARLEDPMAMYRADLLTVPASLAGVAALSLPGPAEGDLPVGVQLFADRGRDEVLLAAGAAWQAAHPHHEARPPGARDAEGGR